MAVNQLQNGSEVKFEGRNVKKEKHKNKSLKIYSAIQPLWTGQKNLKQLMNKQQKMKLVEKFF